MLRFNWLLAIRSIMRRFTSLSRNTASVQMSTTSLNSLKVTGLTLGEGSQITAQVEHPWDSGGENVVRERRWPRYTRLSKLHLYLSLESGQLCQQSCSDDRAICRTHVTPESWQAVIKARLKVLVILGLRCQKAQTIF